MFATLAAPELRGSWTCRRKNDWFDPTPQQDRCPKAKADLVSGYWRYKVQTNLKSVDYILEFVRRLKVNTKDCYRGITKADVLATTTSQRCRQSWPVLAPMLVLLGEMKTQWSTIYSDKLPRHDIVVQLDLTWYDYARLYLSPISQRCISFEFPKRILSQPYCTNCTIVIQPNNSLQLRPHGPSGHCCLGMFGLQSLLQKKPEARLQLPRRWSGSTLPCDKTGTLFHNLETQGLSPE